MTPQLQAPSMGLTADARPDPKFLPNAGKGGLPAWVAAGDGRADQTPLVVVHGIKRAAQAALETVRRDPAVKGRPLVAPFFAEDAWPRYQQATERGRADLAFIGLLRELGAAGAQGAPAPDGRIDILGYSGGAQFAHRFAMLYPHLVRRLILVASGWYTFPDASPWPYGLGEGSKWAALAAERLEAFLTLEIDVAVGVRDIESDQYLRRGEEIDCLQGCDRVARARGWVEALKAVARAQGRPAPMVRLHMLPNTGHDFTDCVEKGGLLPRVFSRRRRAPVRRAGLAASLRSP